MQPESNEAGAYTVLKDGAYVGRFRSVIEAMTAAKEVAGSSKVVVRMNGQLFWTNDRTVYS